MALATELQEFLAGVKAAAADGKVTLDEIASVARDLADCVAPLVDAIEPGNAAAVEQLALDAERVARDAIAALPDGRFGVKAIANGAVGYVVPSLIRQAAVAGQPAHAWIQEHIVPGLATVEQVAHSFRVAFSE